MGNLANVESISAAGSFIRSCLALILCGGMAACGEGTPSAGGASSLPALSAAATSAVPMEYTVTNLAEDGTANQDSISPQGKVIFNTFTLASSGGGTNGFTANYYDGSQIYPVTQTFGLALAVNDAGQVVGTRRSNANLKPFLWTVEGGAVDLLPEATTNGLAADVNAAGEVAFQIEDAQTAGVQRPYLRKNGVTSALAGFPNGTVPGRISLNAQGAIAGDYRAVVEEAGSTTETHGYVWKDGVKTDLGIIGERQPELSYSVETKNINDSGQVVGNITTYTQAPFSSRLQAFAWTPQSGRMTALGSLKADRTGTSVVLHSNNLGQVVGNAMTDNGTLHAYSWTEAGGMVDLTPGIGSSEALAVNNLGQVVGYFGADLQTASGYIWSQSEGLIDLNTRTPRALRDSGFRILAGLAISDTGSILATSNAGLVLLTPGVPSVAPPSIGPITGNIILSVGTQLTVSANFVDTDLADTHVAQWAWGDGTFSTAAVSESGGSGTAAGNHAFLSPGIYKATLTVTDSTGRSAQVAQDIVVYDPAGGFVTGGGWIQSPPGAYRPDLSSSGRATFSFVSKYAKGATVPSGRTEFRFVSARFIFSSTSYDWLVVSGARAQYKGSGSINGVGGYKFILTAIDGDRQGKPDRFRIKIFHTDPDSGQEVIYYDNQTAGDTEGTSDEGTLVNGGSIIVHKS